MPSTSPETGNTVTAPEVVIRPMPPLVVNHIAPSRPAVMTPAPLFAASGKSVTPPDVVMRPMVLLMLLVNHRAPSGPAVMSRGL